MMHIALTLAVKHCYVDSPILISGTELQASCRVEQIRIKDDRTVLPVWDVDTARLALI